MLPTILLLGVLAQSHPIETCKIARIEDKATDKQVALTCSEDKATGEVTGYVIRLPVWPKEWAGADHEGAIVKLQTVEGGWIAIASCKARIDAAEKEARKKRGERAMPANWYVPKDCQGEDQP